MHQLDGDVLCCSTILVNIYPKVFVLDGCSQFYFSINQLLLMRCTNKNEEHLVVQDFIWQFVYMELICCIARLKLSHTHRYILLKGEFTVIRNI